MKNYISLNGKKIKLTPDQAKEMAKLVSAGKLSKEKFDNSYRAWKNHISHGNCYKLSKSTDEIINRRI